MNNNISYRNPSSNSCVEIIAISDWLENAFSNDQIRHLCNDNDNAKYCTSFSCGANLLASFLCSLNSEKEIVCTCFFMNEKTSDNSSFDNLLFFTISSKFFPISKKIKSEEINSYCLRIEFNRKTLKISPFVNNAEYNLFASTIINLIYSDSKNLFDKAMSVLNESSFASFSDNCDLDTREFNRAILSNSDLSNLAIAKDSFNFETFFISCSSSSGMDILISAILLIEDNRLFKYFEYFYQLIRENNGSN